MKKTILHNGNYEFVSQVKYLTPQRELQPKPVEREDHFRHAVNRSKLPYPKIGCGRTYVTKMVTMTIQ